MTAVAAIDWPSVKREPTCIDIDVTSDDYFRASGSTTAHPVDVTPAMAGVAVKAARGARRIQGPYAGFLFHC